MADLLRYPQFGKQGAAQRVESAVTSAAWKWQTHPPIEGHAPTGEHHHPVREQDRLVDVVGDV
jgi:hypothetical protein